MLHQGFIFYASLKYRFFFFRYVFLYENGQKALIDIKVCAIYAWYKHVYIFIVCKLIKPIYKYRSSWLLVTKYFCGEIILFLILDQYD